MKTYRSKVDVWLLLLVFIPIGYPLVEAIIEAEWIAIAALLSVIAFVVYLMFAIKYVVNGDILEIKAGFMGTTKVPIAEISAVEKSNNAMSSPAMSLQRLEIWYGGKYNSIVISPPDREAFVKELLKINPDITLKNLIVPE